jgi:hypothetical protein
MVQPVKIRSSTSNPWNRSEKWAQYDKDRAKIKPFVLSPSRLYNLLVALSIFWQFPLGYLKTPQLTPVRYFSIGLHKGKSFGKVVKALTKLGPASIISYEK